MPTAGAPEAPVPAVAAAQVRAVEPPPRRPRVPYRVVSVAGSGSDTVVTLLDPDLQRTHTVRAGGWVDGELEVVSADFDTVTLRGPGRTYRLPVSAGARWGPGRDRAPAPAAASAGLSTRCARDG